jgi:hypothetical protein
MIRVFPRRTRWTPTDDLAFVGDPGLFRPALMPVKVSVTFTWDIQEGERLFRAWSVFYPDVDLGGPAFGDPGGEFVPGRFVRPGVVVTSRGCVKDCRWCLVPGREGWIKELPIADGWDVIDNNLLACSRGHIESVFNMLRGQPRPIKFSGGLDIDMLQPWHIGLLKTIRIEHLWVACDYPGAMEKLKRAAELLRDFSRAKKRCYVLIGYDGETIRQAENRLKSVYRLGFLPFAMLYRPGDKPLRWGKDWRWLQKTWARPAAFKAIMRDDKKGVE